MDEVRDDAEIHLSTCGPQKLPKDTERRDDLRPGDYDDDDEE